jgi:type II secretory pathway pseudopilin PulG
MHPAQPAPSARTAPSSGFTLLEIQVALLLLAVGVGALLRTAALDVRMVGQGRQTTRAVLAAQARLEALRAAAAAPPFCAGLLAGSDTSSGGILVRWIIGGAGPLRRITVMAGYRVAGGAREDSLSTTIRCPP